MVRRFDNHDQEAIAELRRATAMADLTDGGLIIVEPPPDALFSGPTPYDDTVVVHMDGSSDWTRPSGAPTSVWWLPTGTRWSASASVGSTRSESSGWVAETDTWTRCACGRHISAGAWGQHFFSLAFEPCSEQAWSPRPWKRTKTTLRRLPTSTSSSVSARSGGGPLTARS
jgi:hypothetical protein